MSGYLFQFNPDAAAPNSNFGTMVQVSQQGADTGTGSQWAEPLAANLFCQYNRATLMGVLNPPGVFSATVQPDGVLNNTAGNALRSQFAYTADLPPTTTWAFTFDLVSGFSVSGNAPFGLSLRIFRSTSLIGANAVEITNAIQYTTTLVSTGQTQQATVTWTQPGTVSLNNEFIFIQLAANTNPPNGVNAPIWTFRGGTLQITLPSQTRQCSNSCCGCCPGRSLPSTVHASGTTTCLDIHGNEQAWLSFNGTLGCGLNLQFACDEQFAVLQACGGWVQTFSATNNCNVFPFKLGNWHIFLEAYCRQPNVCGNYTFRAGLYSDASLFVPPAFDGYNFETALLQQPNPNSCSCQPLRVEWDHVPLYNSAFSGVNPGPIVGYITLVIQE